MHATVLRSVLLLTVLTASVSAADFGHPGGPLPERLDPVYEAVHPEAYDLEVLVSFGTSKKGSGGHLALAVKDAGASDATVYSANFYADRDPAHAEGHYLDDLMCRIPKKEYLFGTRSSLGPDASFGLDYGEIYKRSVIGVRLAGVPTEVKAGLVAFFERMNEDYRADRSETDYHKGRIAYDYMDLNCAKTIAYAFRHGAGWRDLKIKGTGFLANLNPFKPLKANVPMETTIDLIEGAARRGWGIEVVLYKKYEHSDHVDPHEPELGPFRDLPNRFPSALSLDYAQDQGHYEDYTNLRAMYLLYHLGRFSVRVDPSTLRIELEKSAEPRSYDEADAIAVEAAQREKKHLIRRLLFRAWGIRIGDSVDNGHLYDYEDPDPTDASP